MLCVKYFKVKEVLKKNGFTLYSSENVLPSCQAIFFFFLKYIKIIWRVQLPASGSLELGEVAITASGGSSHLCLPEGYDYFILSLQPDPCYCSHNASLGIG